MARPGCSYLADGAFACGGAAQRFPSDAPFRPPEAAAPFACPKAVPPETLATRARSSGGYWTGDVPSPEANRLAPAPPAAAPGQPGGSPYMPLAQFADPIA